MWTCSSPSRQQRAVLHRCPCASRMRATRSIAASATFGVESVDDFGINVGQRPTERAHVPFLAPTRSAVDQFHDAAVRVGGRSKSGPNLRPEYHEQYYAAYVFDPPREQDRSRPSREVKTLTTLRRTPQPTQPRWNGGYEAPVEGFSGLNMGVGTGVTAWLRSPGNDWCKRARPEGQWLPVPGEAAGLARHTGRPGRIGPRPSSRRPAGWRRVQRGEDGELLRGGRLGMATSVEDRGIQRGAWSSTRRVACGSTRRGGRH